MVRSVSAVVLFVVPPITAAGAGAQIPDSVRADTAAPVIALPALEATVTRGPLPAERTPFTVTRLDGARVLHARQRIGLDEALLTVPGLVADNRYNFSLGTRIAVRGLGARAAFGVRGVRILVDGLPLTLPDGQATLTNVDLASAGRIDVLRGPASVLYGNAAGGVVAIETEEPPDSGLARARLLVGDHGTDRAQTLRRADITVGDRSDRSSWIVSASEMRLDGFREHSAARRTAVNARVRRALANGAVVSGVLNVAHAPTAESPGGVPVDTFLVRPRAAWPGNVRTGSGEAATQAQLGLRYARAAGTHTMDLAVYGLARSLDNALPFAYIRLGRVGGGMRASFRSRTDVLGREVAVTAGFDAELQRDDREERDNVLGAPGDVLVRDQVDQVGALGPFLHAQAALTDILDVRAGLRYDAVRFTVADRLDAAPEDRSGARTLDAASGFAGVVLRPAARMAVYGNVATAFQTPTTTELINAPPAPGSPCCPGGFNPELEPERVLSYELGLRGSAGPVAGEVVAYSMTVRDALVPFQVAGVPGREFFRNAGRTRHKGLELGLSLDMGNGLSGGVSYALTHVVFLDDGLDAADYEGNRVPGIPPHRLTASVTHASERAFLSLDAVAVARYWADDANTAANPPDGSSAPWDGFVTLDLRGGTAFDLAGARIAPFVGIRNLLDERYAASVVVNAFGGRYYEPAPGRNLYVGLEVRLHPDRR